MAVQHGRFFLIFVSVETDEVTSGQSQQRKATLHFQRAQSASRFARPGAPANADLQSAAKPGKTGFPVFDAPLISNKIATVDGKVCPRPPEQPRQAANSDLRGQPRIVAQPIVSS